MRFPVIIVRNTTTGEEHIVGTDEHDMLNIENGKISYYNLQDGGGIGDGYEFKIFVEKPEPCHEYENLVRMISFFELQDMYIKLQTIDARRHMMGCLKKLNESILLALEKLQDPSDTRKTMGDKF